MGDKSILSIVSKDVFVNDKTGTLNLTSLGQNNPEYVILHSTYSYLEFEDVLRKHRANRWAGMGYHLFVSNSNRVSQGRPFDKEGAHAIGFNRNSIGICIYSDRTKFDNKRIDSAKELIKKIKSVYGEIPVIPHTLAQIKYNNELFEKTGLDVRIEEVLDVSREDVFKKIKEEFSFISNRLSSSKHFELKQSLKSLKNCPGEIFYRVIEHV